MIAPLRTSALELSTESVQERFLALLPRIRQQSAMALRGLQAEARDELAQEIVANAYCAFVKLVRRGKVSMAYATPLAQYAIRQIRYGRCIGSRQNINDVLSPQARRAYRLTIEPLDQRDQRTGIWNEVLVEDRRAGPAETATARMDLAAWFGTLSKRNRRIAQALAVGEPTSTVAQQFRLSAGRISQLRSGFRRHWERFQGGERSAIRLA